MTYIPATMDFSKVYTYVSNIYSIPTTTSTVTAMFADYTAKLSVNENPKATSDNL